MWRVAGGNGIGLYSSPSIVSHNQSVHRWVGQQDPISRWHYHALANHVLGHGQRQRIVWRETHAGIVTPRKQGHVQIPLADIPRRWDTKTKRGFRPGRNHVNAVGELGGCAGWFCEEECRCFHRRFSFSCEFGPLDCRRAPDRDVERRGQFADGALDRSSYIGVSLIVSAGSPSARLSQNGVFARADTVERGQGSIPAR
jgi:hypothetical protein